MVPDAEKSMIELFGERAAFHQTERMLYSTDIGNIPEFARNLILSVPDAVVQPVNTNELVKLMELAGRYSLPLIPRGTGTSGYGGAIPVKSGVVVDFHRMSRIIDIDKGKKIVTVEPGVVWNDLEKGLNKDGLSLRLYPGSMLSATVGGWLATGGGIGIGSFEYGYFVDNIVEVETVSPSGIKKINKDNIYLVHGLAGTTGFISSITLQVRDKSNHITVATAFNTLKDMVGFFTDIKKENLPLWHIGYRDPLHVKLTYEAMEKQVKRRHRHSDIPSLPRNKFIALVAYPEDREVKVRNKLSSITGAHRGELLDEKASKFEWDESLYPMRLKALGPSIIPSEAVFPTEKLPDVIKRSGGAAFTGSLVNKGTDTAVMAYFLDDERRRGFTLAFAKSFNLVKAAKKAGGRPYTTGLYMSIEADAVHGKELLRRIYAYKKEVDPAGILNPGKVFPLALDKNSPAKTLKRLLKVADNMNDLGRMADKLARPLIGGGAVNKNTPTRLRLSDELKLDSFACASCGYCRNECPEFKAIGWESSSPRGKFNFLRQYLKGKAELDERMAEMFFVCTTCAQCTTACQIETPVEDDWALALRPAVREAGFNPPLVMMQQSTNILVSHNPSGSKPEARKDWMTPDLRYRNEGEIGYFAGCAASYNYGLRNLPVNALRVMNKAGIEPVYLGTDEWCCGGTMFTTGCHDEVAETIKHNIDEFTKRGVKTLITSCSGCWLHLAHFYPVFARKLGLEFKLDVKHITQYTSQLIKTGAIKCTIPVNIKVTFHDPCHIGRAGGIYEPPREVMNAIPGLELIEMPRNREHAACCGRHVNRYPRLGNIINSDRINEAIRTGASALVGTCPTCETNLRLGMEEVKGSMEVIDILDLVAYSSGLPVLAISRLEMLINRSTGGLYAGISH